MSHVENEPAPLVVYEREGAIATIMFNRPDKLNAMSDALAIEFGEVMRRFDADDAAYVAILHGAGRSFSAGADVQQRQLRSADEVKRLGGLAGRGANVGHMFADVVNWKPIVSAVHGHCMGMALGLALDSEVIVATENAKFQMTEVSRGLGGERYYALMQYRGAGTFANEVAMTGRFFTGLEAHRGGLINRVVAPGEHLTVAREIAAQIAQNPPLSARAIVRHRRFEIEQLKSRADFNSAALKLNQTDDFRESARAFVEKRPAGPFQGR